MENPFDLEEIYVQLEEELTLIAEEALSPVKKAASSLALIRTTVAELRGSILKAGFSDQAAEIRFFKLAKPRFYSLLMLETELLLLEHGSLEVPPAGLIAFYEEELRAIARLFRKYAFQYEYYRMQADELDAICFVRGAAPASMLVLEMPEHDPEFTTAWDHLFARFRAMELLRDHILHVLENLSGRETTAGEIRAGRKAVPLKWTGDTIHAVELGYSIWLSEQLNGGEADLADIMFWLGSTLSIDLSRYTRLFVEIKARKIISKTKFLDLMKDAAIRYMKLGDEYKPLRKAKRIGSA